MNTLLILGGFIAGALLVVLVIVVVITKLFRKESKVIERNTIIMALVAFPFIFGSQVTKISILKIVEIEKDVEHLKTENQKSKELLSKLNALAKETEDKQAVLAKTTTGEVAELNGRLKSLENEIRLTQIKLGRALTYAGDYKKGIDKYEGLDFKVRKLGMNIEETKGMVYVLENMLKGYQHMPKKPITAGPERPTPESPPETTPDKPSTVPDTKRPTPQFTPPPTPDKPSAIPEDLR